jgi:hypothetical protein
MEDMARQGKQWRREDKAADEKNKTVRHKAPFSVPASLRSIPGSKTIAEEVKERFRRKLGREATPEELVGIAADLAGQYQASNQEHIASIWLPTTVTIRVFSLERRCNASKSLVRQHRLTSLTSGRTRSI